MAQDDGELLQGQRYDEVADIVIAYTEQMKYEENADASVGVARTDVTPNDAHSSKVRTWAQPSLTSIYLRTPGVVNLQLPSVLSSITTTFNKSGGNGENVREIGDAAWVGASGGMNLNPNASASGSASIIPDVNIEITETWGNNIPTEQFFFYIAGNVTTVDVLSRLQTILTLATTGIVAGVVTTSAAHGLSVGQPFTFLTLVGGAGGIATATTYYVLTTPTTLTFTYAASAGGAALNTHSATSGTLAPAVSAWPSFRPKSHTLTLKGEQKSVSVNAEANFTYRWSDSDVSYAYSPAQTAVGPPAVFSQSDGISEENSVTVRSVRIPPTIHGAITIATATDTATFSVTAEADIPAITGTGGAPNFVGTNSTRSSGTITVNAGVTPTSLSATSGATAIPTAGLYIYDVTAERGRYGQTNVRVTLVNFNAFA